MKRFLSLCLLAALSGGFVSCTRVTVTEPFGTKPAELDPQAWDGVWRFDDGNRGRIAVSKERPGEFVFSEVLDPGVEPEEQSEDLTVVVRDVGGDLFFTVVAAGEEAATGEGMVWGRIALNDNTALVWLPDVDAFAPLVKNGTLPGEDKRKKDEKSGALSGAIELGKLGEEDTTAIGTGTHGVLFAWDEPTVLVREPWREAEKAEEDEEAEERVRHPR